MTDPGSAFGRNLARRRTARGWSQEEAALRTGLGIATINRVEHGGGCYLSSAITLAAAYDTTIDALLTDTPEPPS
jgi:transcriptional regulator with XRE-family HTH domain